MMFSKNVVVVAPHPDDEILGAGGTIARLSSGDTNVHVLYVSGHLPPLYPRNSFEVTKSEAIAACNILGVTSTNFLEIPATKVNEVPTADLNRQVDEFIKRFNAELVFIPFPDRHVDHRIIFDACMVATRPLNKASPKWVLAYETLSETHWNAAGIEPQFVPDLFVDITDYKAQKLKALSEYKSQITGNQSRSPNAVEALGKFRGSQNACEFAEAYKVIRIII